MAYTGINKSTDYFNTKIYTGNGGTQSITGIGHQPDLVWIKSRGYAEDHQLTDSVRGVTKSLQSNLNNVAESTFTDGLTAFGTDGFSVGSKSDFNYNNDNLVAWNWKAGTTGSGNTTGSGTYKAYSYSVNTTAGFSIVKYVGNGSAGHTIPHHLNAVPSMMIIKDISVSSEFKIYHKSMANTEMVVFDGANKWTSRTEWNSTTPTSTVFSLGNQANVNTNDRSYIAYVFSEKSGYSKCNSYIGNNSANGTFVYTGFKPSFVMIKHINGSSNWTINDTGRDPTNVNNIRLFPNQNVVESSGSNSMDMLSNGFKLRSTDGGNNGNNDIYIYMAIGQSLVGSNNVPATAR